MRPLNRVQTLAWVLGALLMVVGMGCYVFLLRNFYAAVAYLFGSVLFAVFQCMQTYEGNDFTIRRLKNMLTLADILFVVTGILLIDTSTKFFLPLFRNMNTYFNYVYNKWLVVLLVAVILELYAVNRIAYMLRKSKEKEEGENKGEGGEPK